MFGRVNLGDGGDDFDRVCIAHRAARLLDFSVGEEGPVAVAEFSAAAGQGGKKKVEDGDSGLNKSAILKCNV